MADGAFDLGDIDIIFEAAAGRLQQALRGDGRTDRCADAVAEERDLLAGAKGGCHFAEEGLTSQTGIANQHGQATDECVAVSGEDPFFGQGFVLAVDVDGGGGVVLGVRGLGAVEDEVGGGEDKWDVCVAAEGGQVDRREHIDAKGVVRVLFTEVEVVDGGGMDNGRRLHIGQHCFGLAEIGQVDAPAVDVAEEELRVAAGCAVVGSYRVPAFLRGLQQMGAEEAGRAGDEQLRRHFTSARLGSRRPSNPGPTL